MLFLWLLTEVWLYCLISNKMVTWSCPSWRPLPLNQRMDCFACEGTSTLHIHISPAVFNLVMCFCPLPPGGGVWIHGCLLIAPWSLFDSALIGQSWCVWGLDELRSRSGRLPPPPDLLCRAPLLSPWVGPPLDALPEPVLLWQSSWEGHFCSECFPSSFLLNIGTLQLTVHRPCFPPPDGLPVLHKGDRFGLALQWDDAFCWYLAPPLGGGLSSALRYGKLWDLDLLLKSRLVRRRCKKTLLTRVGDHWNAQLVLCDFCNDRKIFKVVTHHLF